MHLIIGNIIALLGSILMVIMGYVKTKKKTLLVQIAQITLLTISNLILGGISGAIINIIAILRNILSYFNKLNKPAMAIIIVLSIVIPLIFNHESIFGLLPIFAAVTFTLCLNSKDIIKIKYSIIISITFWLIYDIKLLSIAALFDLLTIISAAISIYQIKKKNS